MEIPEHDEPPLRLRPTWRRPALVVPWLVAGPLLVAVGVATGSAIGWYAGGVLIAYIARTSIVMTRGLTDAWPDGLSNRLAGQPAEITWERVERLVVEPTLVGRFVQVEEVDGARTTLAAPRSGIMADGRDFEADLDRLRVMPGGGRAALRVESASHLPTVLMQLLLLTGLVMAIFIAIAR